MSMDFLHRTDAATLKGVKKLVGFGAGVLGARTQAFFDGAMDSFVDNDPDKWGKPWDGCCGVRPVDSLEREDPDRTVLVLCTEQFEQVGRELARRFPGIALYRSPLLRDYEVFDRLLACSERLLVSGYGPAGGLYLVNARTGTWRLLVPGSFRGLARADEKLFAATEQGAVMEITSLHPFAMEERLAPRPGCQMHGLAWWENGNCLVAAEAGNDRLVLVSLEDFRITHAIPLLEEAQMGRDRCHVNDLAVQEDIVLVSMLSRSGQWNEGRHDGVVLNLDLNGSREPEVVVQGLLFPHSVHLHEGELFFVDSLDGCVHGHGRILARLNGFIRGLEITPDVLHVGQSRHRRMADAARYLESVSMDCGLYVLDRDTATHRFIRLPEMCDVYDILDLEQGPWPGVGPERTQASSDMDGDKDMDTGMDRDQANRAVYERIYRAGGEMLLHPDEALVSYVHGVLRKEPRVRTIFDAGFGAGRHVHLLASLGYEVHGCEPSAEALAFALARLERDGLTARLEQGVCSAIRREDETVDVVLCWGVANTLVSDEELQASIREMRRILKPGGRLLLSLTSREDMKFSGAEPVAGNLYAISYQGEPYFCRFWDREGAMRLVEEAGFDLVSMGHVLRNMHLDGTKPIGYHALVARKPDRDGT